MEITADATYVVVPATNIFQKCVASRSHNLERYFTVALRMVVVIAGDMVHRLSPYRRLEACQATRDWASALDGPCCAAYKCQQRRVGRSA